MRDFRSARVQECRSAAVPKIILLAALFAFHFSLLTAQTRMRDVIVHMPDSVLALLTSVNRADCVDFREADMPAKVSNRLGGTTELITLTDDYALWQYTAASQVEMKLLPTNDSTSIICLVHTVQTPVPDSHIRFFDQTWAPLAVGALITLPQPGATPSALRTMPIRLSPDALVLHAELRNDNYNMGDEDATLTPVTEARSFRWNQGRFINDDDETIY